jgi:hypothetical protein
VRPVESKPIPEQAQTFETWVETRWALAAGCVLCSELSPQPAARARPRCDHMVASAAAGAEKAAL